MNKGSNLPWEPIYSGFVFLEGGRALGITHVISKAGSKDEEEAGEAPPSVQ